MAVNPLANCTVPEIFKDFKEGHHHYLHRRFRITTVHADGKFGPLKSLIKFLPEGLLVHLPAANEDVLDIKIRIRVGVQR